MLRRYWFTWLVVVPLIALAQMPDAAAKAAKKQRLPVTLQASTDAEGQAHPASVEFAGSAIARCTRAQGPHAFRANCSINGAVVSPGNSVAATGKVTLRCNGQEPPLSCSVVVSPD
jgi:hypothetical protein